MNKDVYIIIPVYNEEKAIEQVVSNVSRHFSNIVCVDDGSKDKSAEVIQGTKAKLVSHAVNLGQGAALQTGIEYALTDARAQYFVTFDADGQHDIKDVKKMLQHIRKNKSIEIVLGSRFLGEVKNISRLKKHVLKLAIKFSNLTSGLKLTDAHNGLRVFNRKVAESLNITMPDMAHASEIVHRIAEKNFKYKELPVTISYSEYSKAKGQPVINAVNISFDILLQRISKK